MLIEMQLLLKCFDAENGYVQLLEQLLLAASANKF